jgi:predicted dehydrogenase
VLLTYPEICREVIDLNKASVPVIKSTLPVKGADFVRLGVLGAGNFATSVMLPALKKNPSIELISITSGSGFHAQSASKKFGFKFTAANENEILQDPEVNTICILTRHHLHAEQIVRSLQAGKHVFCENH